MRSAAEAFVDQLKRASRQEIVGNMAGPYILDFLSGSAPGGGAWSPHFTVIGQELDAKRDLPRKGI
jgi:hypothetical protein